MLKTAFLYSIIEKNSNKILKSFNFGQLRTSFDNVLAKFQLNPRETHWPSSILLKAFSTLRDTF